MARPHRLTGLTLLLWPLLLGAQTPPPPQLAGILERLDRLERENRALSEEVHALRAELDRARTAAAPVPPPAAEAPSGTQATLEQKVEIQGQRIEEQAQTKVEASQRLPIRLTGMALFNTFLDSRQSGGADYPTVAAGPGQSHAGATLRQTIIGLEYNGAQTLLGGKVHGNLDMDFYNGSYAGGGASSSLTLWARLRTASIEIDWKDRSIMAGLGKPIFNPREPASLAQVGISPLTGAGNLWLWVPQIRAEQDLSFGWSSGVRARVGVIQTHEIGPYDAAGFTGKVAPARPGVEGRFEFFHNLDEERHLEIAAGFHSSVTHAGGFSVPSNLFSLDWFFNPWRRVEFTGAFYSGQNVANLGTGAISQGYVLYSRYAAAIGSRGGWGQLTVHADKRLDFHLFTGQQDDANRRLGAGDIGKNLLYGVNLFYHLAPNVLLGPEVSQLRTTYLGQGVRINNHYDLALGYLF